MDSKQAAPKDPKVEKSTSAAASPAAAGSKEQAAKNAVLVISEEMPPNATPVKGYDFNAGINYEAMFKAYATTGFQATQLAQAVDEINRMVCSRSFFPLCSC
jgi:hypothetical protein